MIHLERLLARLRAAGHEVSWRIEGPISEPPTVYVLIVDGKEAWRGDDWAEAGRGLSRVRT